MKRKPSVEHLEDAVILAFLDGELSRGSRAKGETPPAELLEMPIRRRRA